MNNSNLFKQAHKMTRKTIKKGDNYQLTFALCLKVLISEQSVKITTYNSDKSLTVTYQPKRKVNKRCAMVGDYIKPTYKVDRLKVHHIKNPCLTVTYNIDNLLHFALSSIIIMTMFYGVLLAIVN